MRSYARWTSNSNSHRSLCILSTHMLNRITISHLSTSIALTLIRWYQLLIWNNTHSQMCIQKADLVISHSLIVRLTKSEWTIYTTLISCNVINSLCWYICQGYANGSKSSLHICYSDYNELLFYPSLSNISDILRARLEVRRCCEAFYPSLWR